MVQGFNNLSAYQQMLADTAPKPTEYAAADKIARALSGGKDYMPRTIMQKQPTVTPGFSPIKGVGGVIGAGAMLLPEWNRFTKNIWRGMNLNTMDPMVRDEYLRGYQKTMKMFGKDVEGELQSKYPGYQFAKDKKQRVSSASMPWIAGGINNIAEWIANDKGAPDGQSTPDPTSKPKQDSTKGSGRASGGGLTGMAAPTLEGQLQELLSGAPKAKEGASGESSDKNIQAINDYISKLQEVNQPYTEALNNYINNYNDLVRGNFNAQRYFTAMAGLSGNQGYNKLAEALNPLNNEANRINAMKMVRDAEAGNVNAINEMMGNLAMAEELGLPPEAAFANKNLLTAMSMQDREKTKLEIALANNLVKKYGIDKNYARAIAQQQLRNQGSLAVANTYMSGGGQPGRGLTQQGTAQPSNSAEGALFKQVVGR